MVKVVNGRVVVTVPFKAGAWGAERVLADEVVAAVDRYMWELADEYQPEQERFDEAALRQHVEEIVRDAAQYVVDGWLAEFARLHSERWAGRRVPA